MQLILTHENADFDAVAAQLGAYKLHPEAIPLLSRRINHNVQQFLTLYWDALPFIHANDWQRRRIESVILVDTQGLNSVRGMARRPKAHVIDHHDQRATHEGWTFELAEVGAATTLLVEKLQTAGLSVSHEEATLLLLGIYEDTGSLTYDTTTSRDARAAAWLMEQGAQLEVVRRFLNIALTPNQLFLYDRLQKGTQWLTIEGQEVVVAVAEAPEDFMDEVSAVAHRLREALRPAGLFALVQLHHDVQLVARSNTDFIDAGFIAHAFGGGGHSRAAAALVVGQPAARVRSRLLELLPQAVKPMARVEQIMSRGVQTLPPSLPIAEAAMLMQRFGHEGYPVVEGQKLVGLLTRRAVDRAINHDMGRLPVSRIMQAGAITVRPFDSVQMVQKLMLEEGWGQIPVVVSPDTPPIGVVTRTDVLNFLFKPPPSESPPDLRQLLTELLPPLLWQMVLVISHAANSLHMPLYFVGGLVRDLLLHKPPTDLDMVVEGDAIKLVRQIQEAYGGEVHTHAQFGTGKWLLTPAIWQAVAEKQAGPSAVSTAVATLPTSIDFVTARTEFYTEPTALPQVERGSIKLDLHRRDFAINTLAVRLDGAHLGELLDFYGGVRDLSQKVIRVLHSLSFIDDPTRILRAVRLEQRLGFAIEPRTAELIASALPLLERVTGTRLKHEVELLFQEAAPGPILARLAELQVLSHIYAGLAWSETTAVTFAHVPHLLNQAPWQMVLGQESPEFVYFALWLHPLPFAVQEGVMGRLVVRRDTRQDVAAVGQVMAALAGLPPSPKPSQIEKALRPFNPRVLFVARVLQEGLATAVWLDSYYGEWRQVRTAVNGDTLRQWGLKPGPQYAHILDALLAARLDGEISDEAGEHAFLRQWLRQQAEGSAK